MRPRATANLTPGVVDARVSSVSGPNAPLLRVVDVGKRFADGGGSRWVVRNVSLSLAPGRTVALWGPSGAGKTTLLNLMAGLTVPDEGRVECAVGKNGWFDVSAAAEKQRTRFRRRDVGFVFQFFNLVPTLTVAENVLLPLALNGLQAHREQALTRLDSLGLAHCRQRFPHTLSGGEQQRAAIARALAHRPRVLLADEPTGNLDAVNAGRVTDLLWENTREVGCALVVATHNEAVAARADEVVRLAET